MLVSLGVIVVVALKGATELNGVVTAAEIAEPVILQ